MTITPHREMLLSEYSDAYKERHNIRPHHGEWLAQVSDRGLEAIVFDLYGIETEEQKIAKQLATQTRRELAEIVRKETSPTMSSVWPS